MKSIERTYVVFAMAGAIAAILQLPFFNGLLKLPGPVYAVVPGLIFALSVTVAATFLMRYRVVRPEAMKQYILGGVILAAGMPLALVVGLASLATIDHIAPGDKFQLGGIGLPFFFAEIVSCVVWSFVIFIWGILTNRARAPQVLRLALLVTCAVMLSANLVEIISKTLWQKSSLLPVISVAEEVGSALVLATGCAGYWMRRQVSVTEP